MKFATVPSLKRSKVIHTLYNKCLLPLKRTLNIIYFRHPRVFNQKQMFYKPKKYRLLI